MAASYDPGLRKWRRDPQSKLTRETGHIRKFWIGLEMGLNSGRSRSLDSLHRSSASKYVCICGHAPIYMYTHTHICTCMPQTQTHMHKMKKQKFPYERMKLPTSLNRHPSEPVHFVAVPSNERDAQVFMPDTLVLKETHPWMFESWAEPTPFFIKYPLFEKKKWLADKWWLSGLGYMENIFLWMNRAWLSLQGKQSTVFVVIAKTHVFKPIRIWEICMHIVSVMV